MVTCSVTPKGHFWASLIFCLHQYMKLACGNMQTKDPYYLTLPLLNLSSHEPKPWFILKHTQTLCFNLFFLLQKANKKASNTLDITNASSHRQSSKTLSSKCSPIFSQELLFLLPLQLLSRDLIGVLLMQGLLSTKSHAALVCFNYIDLAVMFASPLKPLPKTTHRKVLET